MSAPSSVSAEAYGKWIYALALYDVGAGPMLDIGPYLVTRLIKFLGPAVAVTACDSNGEDFRIGGPDPGPQVYPVNVPVRH